MFTFFESPPHTHSQEDTVQGSLALTHEERQAFAHLGLPRFLGLA